MKKISENTSTWSQTTAENQVPTTTKQKNVKKDLLRDILRKQCDHKRAYKGRSDFNHLLLHHKIVQWLRTWHRQRSDVEQERREFAATSQENNDCMHLYL